MATDNFDNLVDQALAEYVASQGVETPEKQADYNAYAELLQEISDEDSELEQTENSIESIIAENEEAPSTEETEEQEPEEQHDPHVDAHKRALSDHARRRLRRIEISRMAFDQTLLPLGEKMPVEHKRLVIELLTAPLQQLIMKYENYINGRVSKLLAPIIPNAVKLAAVKWPWIFIPNPGFLYKTHPQNGPVKTFWVNPSVPYFFKQGTEQVLLEERDATLMPYFLDGIDRAIHRWYNARERLADREVSYAVRLIMMRGNTYYHLLQVNPFWFERLYNHIKEQSNDLV